MVNQRYLLTFQITYLLKNGFKVPVLDVWLSISLEDENLTRLWADSDSGAVSVPVERCNSWQDAIWLGSRLHTNSFINLIFKVHLLNYNYLSHERYFN